MYIQTTFIGTKIGDMNYLFFLLAEDYIYDQRIMLEEINPMLETFACRIGSNGALVKPFQGYVHATELDIMSKNWDKREKSRLAKTPGLLIIDMNFDDFDPRNDHWIHFSFQDMILSSGQVDIFGLRELLITLEEACRENIDIFDLSGYFAEKKFDSSLIKCAQCFEIKPGLFGISFDAKEGLKVIKDMLSSNQI